MQKNRGSFVAFGLLVGLFFSASSAAAPARSDDARTDALYQAAAKGDLAAVKALLAQKVPVNTGAKKTGAWPLPTAAHFNHLDVVQALLAAGADPNLPDEPILRPLSEAASGEADPVECVQVLLKAGARFAGKDGDFAAALAISAGNLNSFRALIKAGAKVSPDAGVSAGSNAGAAFIPVLVELGVDMNSAVGSGDGYDEEMTPLIAAVGTPLGTPETRKQTIEALLKAGADVNRKTSDGNTALREARTMGASADIVRMLVQAGAKQ